MKNITMRISFVLILLALTGCAASMVETTGNKSKYGPVDDSPKGGVIRYLNQGAKFIKQARREDAYKKMYANCDGKYKIVSEGPASGSEVVTVAAGNALVSETSEYWMIKFECVGSSGTAKGVTP